MMSFCSQPRAWPNDGAEIVVLGLPAEHRAYPIGCGDDLRRIAGPASAGSVLLSRGLQFRFDGVGFISMPGLVADASSADFVQEGAPFPVTQ
jgi:hypothetical protein